MQKFNMRDETKCLHSGYYPKNAEPRVVPIVQSTTYVFDSTDDMADAFANPTKAINYSRNANPTVIAVEKKIADLENGIGALCTSSGQAASLISILNICHAGDSFLCAIQAFGGTISLFGTALKRLGIDCTFIDIDANESEINAAIKPNTKAIFGETIANPTLKTLDIEKFAGISKANGIPLIIDNSFATPILCKPIEFGADIVVHSTSKYMDGHAVQVGGVVVDSGNFDWTNGKFPYLSEPDDRGTIYTNEFGKAAYISKARFQLMGNFGMYPAAHSAFLLNIGLETLAVRMERHCKNALIIAKLLESNDKIESVNYPGLKNDINYLLSKKYLKGASGVVTFVIKGGKENANKFINSLKLVSREVHVADIRSSVLHPASSTHRKLTNEQLITIGIKPGMVRLSVGLENVNDIIADIEQSINKI